MLRRIRDQHGHGAQFYLYRVHLRPSVAVRKDWLIDPSNFVGDVVLEEACPPGVDVARYLNYHEDPGGLSLALGRDAIASVQRVSVPLSDAYDNEWVEYVVALVTAAETEEQPSPLADRLSRFLPPASPPCVRVANELAGDLAERLPVNLRRQFRWASAFNEGEDTECWALRVSGLHDLIENPERALA